MRTDYPFLIASAEPPHRRACTMLAPLEPGERRPLVALEGPGTITRLWLGYRCTDRALVLRCYWDGESTPSVDVPLWDFFAVGLQPPTGPHTVIPGGGLETLLPMPFQESAYLELVNLSADQPSGEEPIFAQVDYDAFRPELLREVPGALHARWNRENPASDQGRRFCLVRAVGQGAYVGSVVQIRPQPGASAPWHEAPGELHFIDGEGRSRLLAGTTAGHYVGSCEASRDFAAPQCGLRHQGDSVWLYRFHLDAPITFRNSLYSALGSVAGDYAAVSYWYQNEPHREFATLVDTAAIAPGAHLPPGARDLPGGPQDRVEWLYGDGRRKVVARHMLLDMLETLPRGESLWADREQAVWTSLFAPTSRTGQIYLSYDDRVRLIHNDRLVFERERTDGFGVDPVAVMIPAGENTFRIETTNRANTTCWSWALGFRVANSEGRTIEEMEFRTYPDIPEGRPV